MTLDYIFFDLDGTLLPMDQEAFVQAYFHKLAQMGAARGYDPEALVQAVKHKGIEHSQPLGGSFDHFGAYPPCLAPARLRRLHPKLVQNTSPRGALQFFRSARGSKARKTPQGISVDIFKVFSAVLDRCCPEKPGRVRFPYAYDGD